MITSDADLEAFLEHREKAVYPRRLVAPFFQGNVTAVSQVPQSTAPGMFFQVKVQPVGQPPSDNWYACAVPGYYPVVGDLVEVTWRDEDIGYVILPLISPGRTCSRIWLNAAATIGSGWIILALDSIHFDNMEISQVGASPHGFKIKYDGFYKVTGNAKANANNNPQQFGCAIYQNSGQIAQDIDYGTSVAGNPQAVNCSVIAKCVAGDTIQLAALNNGAGTIAVDNSINSTYMEIEWRP